MLVTIITVAYNSEKTIAKAMESVLNQSYDNIEYIVVDGASKDKTVEVARSFQQAFDERPGRSLYLDGIFQIQKRMNYLNIFSMNCLSNKNYRNNTN